MEEGSIQGCEEEEQLLDSQEQDDDQAVKLEQCGGCNYYAEPLLVVASLAMTPLFMLVPQYVLERELEALTGSPNMSVGGRNACIGAPPPHHNYTGSSDAPSANYTQAQSAASYFQLECGIIQSIPLIIVLTFLGPLSDKKGRKLVMVISLSGFLFFILNLVLNSYFKWPLELLYLGYFICGCTGTWAGVYLGALTLLSDVTTKKERQFRMVLQNIIGVSPTIISNAASGYLKNALGFPLVFFIIFLLFLLLLFYVLFIVPETVRKDKQAAVFSSSHLLRAFTVYLVDDGRGRRGKLLLVVAGLFFTMLVGTGSHINTLFLMNFPLCWGADLVGVYNSIAAGVGVVGSLILGRLFQCCLPQPWIAVIAASTRAANDIFIFFAKTTTFMLASTAFNVTFSLLTSTIRAMLSKIVQPNEVGAVFAGVGVIEVVCDLLGNLIYNPIYSHTQEQGHPSTVYLVMAAFYLIGAAFLMIHAVRCRKEQQQARAGAAGKCDAENCASNETVVAQ